MLEEVRAYCTQRNNRVDPQRFVDFYIAKGWKIGNQPMRDWRAAVRTWERRAEDRGSDEGADQRVREDVERMRRLMERGS